MKQSVTVLGPAASAIGCYGCGTQIVSNPSGLPGGCRHFCPECPGRLSKLAGGYRYRDYSQEAYAGKNEGLGKYVRSKSHYRELVKRGTVGGGKLVEAG